MSGRFMAEAAEQASKDLAEACDGAAQTIGKKLISNAADTEESNLGRSLEGEAKNAEGFHNIMSGLDGEGDAAAGGIRTGSGGVPKGAGDGEDVPSAGGGDPFHESTPAGDRPNCPTDPVDPSSGDMVLQQVDARIPGVLDLIFERVHVSGYRKGRLFGRTWSATLDQRVQVDEDGVHYFAPDGVVLHYPVPAVHGERTLPSAGARWPLSWDRKHDRILIEQTELGRVLEFPPGPRPEDFRPLGALVDRNGNRISFVCGPDGAPTDVFHSGGMHLEVGAVETREGLRIGGLTLATADGGRVTLREFRYDFGGRLVEVVDSSRRPHRFEYDAEDRVTAWVDRIGYRYSYTYDEQGRVIATGGADGALAGRIEYDTEERVTRFTSALGETTAYRMDEHGHVVEVIDPLGAVTRTEQDRYGRVLSKTDELGGVVRIRRDERGDAVSIERQDGSVLAARYNEAHQPVELVDPDGSRWTYEYDERGNLLTVVDPLGSATRYGYDERGALVSSIDALDRQTTVETDLAGLPLAITGATGSRLSLHRDARGRVVRLVDPLGAATELGYDGEDRHLSRTFPDGTTESWRYDDAGNMLAHTDQAGFETLFETGAFRRFTARTDPDGTRHAFEYDSQLRLTAVTNPAGLRWTYTFDAAGNLVGETDFNGRALTYRYDAAGRIVERVNGAGQHVELVRDALGRVIEQRVDGEHVAAFGYDPNGNLTAARNRDTELLLARDVMGRVVEESVDGLAVRTAYDALGQAVERTTPSARQSVWRYDAAGAPTALAADGHEIFFGRDDAGRETYRWIDARTALTQEFDAVGRVAARRMLAVEGEAASTASTSSLLLERVWTYRPDDAPTSVADSVSGVAEFQLDQLGRVTQVTAATWNATYTYDASGNISSARSDTGAPQGSPDADTDGPRELSGTLLRRAGRVKYEYDGQGRLVKAVRRTLSGGEKVSEYVYDAFDRLVEVSTPDRGRWRYRYDPLGRRVAKARLDDDGEALEEYLFSWDGTTLAEQRRVVAGRQVSVTSWDYEPGGFTPVAQETRTFSAELSDQEVDRRFYAVVADLVGTPTELVTPDGRLAWRRRAGLWGEGASPGEALDAGADCPLRFPGQYQDAETGLCYNYERYYDPGTGRYTSPDPLGLVPAPNHHGYVVNPLSHLDPLGLRDEISASGRAKLREIAARHGGVELPDSPHGKGNFMFPNRRAARQAASEVAGDLGSNPSTFRASDYRGAPPKTNPNKVMGANNSDPASTTDNHGSAGWRDDQWGHDFGSGGKVGPHVNAWNNKNGIENSHLYYSCGG